MNRPGTPLTPTQWDNARNTPGPAAYGDPGGMSDKSILPSGGEFCAQELPSVFDVHVAMTRFVPGPGTYSNTIIPMNGGVKFSTAYVPSDVDKLVKKAAKAPSPADYRPEDCSLIYPRPDRNVCPFTTSLRPSFIDEMTRSKRYVPGPGRYQQSSNPNISVRKHKRGGNNSGPHRPQTTSTYMDDIQNIWGTLTGKLYFGTMEMNGTATTPATKNNAVAKAKDAADTSKQRPMTSPEKYRTQQKKLWKEKKNRFPGNKPTRKKRPSTTGVGTRRLNSKSGSRLRKRTVPLKKCNSDNQSIVDAVSSRSRRQLSKKLTSPLWKYEIPKQLRSGSGQSKPSKKSSQKNAHRHNPDTMLNDLFTPTTTRPFLSLKETMELATRDVRAMDASMNSKKRRERMGLL